MMQTHCRHKITRLPTPAPLSSQRSSGSWRPAHIAEYMQWHDEAAADDNRCADQYRLLNLKTRSLS